MVPASAYPGRLQHEIPAIVDRETVPKERILADYFWCVGGLYYRRGLADFVQVCANRLFRSKGSGDARPVDGTFVEDAHAGVSFL